MGIEADIYNELWEHIRSYRTTELSFISKSGWFQYDADNLTQAQLPAVKLVAKAITLNRRMGQGNEYRLEADLVGVVAHFDPQEAAYGATGRTGYLDMAYHLDRVLFSALPFAEVTVDGVTTTARQGGPVFETETQLRDIEIGDTVIRGILETEAEYPIIEVRIPIDLIYIKSDDDRIIP